MSSMKTIFAAVLIAAALLVSGFLIHSARPEIDLARATPAQVRATGKCASCHRQETEAIVVEYERSRHAAVGTTCLDCHTPTDGQDGVEHRGFTITASVTAANCAQCHTSQYTEFLRSRHAAPSMGAVLGSEPFTEEQIAFAERHHPGSVLRPANALVALEGPAATQSGCITCHQIGAPNPDGSIGTCTQCHSRHRASIELARLPQTCGQCHMGPDHSQIEIYTESKHGALFNAFRDELNLKADPRNLTVADMPVPTCATCHMSGLGRSGVTHDVTERLSYWLFDPISEKRPTYTQGRAQMMAICQNCHSTTHTERFFAEAESVLVATNAKVAKATKLMDQLRAEGLLGEPFDQPIEFTYFDLWHYYGRTAKHGAFMGGADFVQWHGNYELLRHQIELEKQAADLRKERNARTTRTAGVAGR